MKCPDNYNKLIFPLKKCVNNCTNESEYKFEYNNSCYKECPNETIQNESDYKCYDNKKVETTFINDNINTPTPIEKDKRDEEIENFRGKINDFNVNESNNDIITTVDNVQIQLTTSDNQKNKTNKNTSTIQPSI